ncbi:anaphase promoting complex subunit 5 [Actinomortierella ambigua]|nr:anaphase promoting complex subunit 5 [Actinomortierella ambigua]
MAGRRVFARTATDISLLTPASGQAGYHSPAPYHRLHAHHHPHHPASLSQEADGTLVATSSQLQLQQEEDGRDPFTAETDAALVVQYLTPHKVSILILVEYYCREMHAASSDSEATLALLKFLLQQIKDPHEYVQSGLRDLLKAVMEIKGSGQIIQEHLIRTLERIRSPYHLEEFMLGQLPIEDDDEYTQQRHVGLLDLVVQSVPRDTDTSAELAPTSILGLYVRKAQMTFRRLSFEEVSRLYTTFETYVAGLRGSEMQQELQDTVGYSGARSMFDAEKYLDAKVTEISSNAIRETIEIARDNLDDECLSYARSWLNRLTMAAPDARDSAAESRTLAALASKTDHPSFHYLQSLSELTKSKHLLGTSVAQSIEALIKGASIGLNHSLDDVGGVVQQYQSKVWGMYGNPALSSLYSQLQQTYRPTETDMGDVAAGYTKHATDLAQQGHFKEAIQVLEQAKMKFPSSTIRSIPWIQTLAQTLQRQAMASKRLKDAEIWINHMATTLRSKDILSSSSVNFALDAQPGTRRGATTEQQQQQRPTGATSGTTPQMATKTRRGAPVGRGGGGGTGTTETGFPTNSAAAASTTTPPPRKPMAIDQDETSVELQLDILLQRALFSAATDQRTEAVEILARGMEAARAHQALWPAGMQRYTVLYMLALAELYMDAPLAAATAGSSHQQSKDGGGGGGGVPTPAGVGVVSTAIPLLLTTMTLSEQRSQRGLFFLATLRLAEALLHLGAVQHAIQLVEGIMTQVLGQADLFTQATAFFQYAKCLLAQLANFVVHEDNDEEREEGDEDQEEEQEEEGGGELGKRKRKRHSGDLHPSPPSQARQQRQQHLIQVQHLLQRAIEGFQQLDSVEDVQQVLYFMIRCHYELGEDQLVAAKLRLFRELGQQARQDQSHRPPSWFAYYYLRHDLTDLLTAPQGTPQRPTASPSK